MTDQDEPAWEEIVELANVIEADLVDSILSERGIPHQVRSFRDGAYGGLFQSQQGWGALLAPPERAREIRDLVDEVRAGGQTP
jgi:hypothetical protein